MRWPLRNQILLPMAILMLGSLVGVSLLNAYFSVQHTRRRIELDLAQVTETLSKSNFPLTNNVLRQMRGLAGAEFIMTDDDGRPIASSMDNGSTPRLPSADSSQADQLLALAKPVVLDERRYFHSRVVLQRPINPNRGTILHILYPEESYRQAWRDVVYPPLVVGSGAIVLVIAFSLGIASRVTQPLRLLQQQLDEIATGSFHALPVPRRNDEIADLSRSINRMAEMLAQYEAEVRRNEQLRTLDQLGGGIAHQMRNSVTGCRMALELHARSCALDCESLDVAKRQLELMESFLRRFLSLGRCDEKPFSLVCLQDVAENVMTLVGPTARHVGVQLECDMPSTPVQVRGNAEALEQSLVNLVLNGIEAAAASQIGQREADAAPNPPSVQISLTELDNRVELTVADTGRGPAADVQARLFQPFVTEKPDGTGLGLTVAHEVAVAHGGVIRWFRQAEKTCFVVELPAAESRELAK